MSWTVLDACKKNCACQNLAGGTYLCVLGNQPQPAAVPLSLQINENKTFLLQTKILQDDVTILGTWECCNGRWYGVAIVGSNALPSVNEEFPHYIRVSLELCPGSLLLRKRIMYLSIPAQECISNVPPHAVTESSSVAECTLQRVGNVCKAALFDFQYDSGES